MRDKEYNNSWLRYLFLPLLVMLGFLSMVVQTTQVDAAMSWTAPKTTVISDNPRQTMDTRYGFVPEFNASGTTRLITPANKGWKDMTYSAAANQGDAVFTTRSLDIGVSNASLAAIEAEVARGEHWGRYTNVGYIDGRSVDLQITITGWDNFGLPSRLYNRTSLGHVSFRKDSIGYVSQGLYYTDLEWKILDSQTGNLVRNVSGYYTFNDIDWEQFVGFPTSTWNNNIDQVMIQNRSNRLNYFGPDIATPYENKNTAAGKGTHDFSYSNRDLRYDAPDDFYDHRHGITVLYSNADSINIRWGYDAGARRHFLPAFSSRTYRYYPLLYSTGDLMMYTTIKPVRTEPGTPVKNVSHNGSGGRVTHNTTVTYTIDQEIPLEHKDFYYKSYELRDQMDSVYDIESVRVLDRNGTNISSRFNITTTNNRVRAVAKAGETAKTSFYNQRYRLEIKAKVNGNRVVSKMGNSSSYSISNTGLSIIDGTEYRSNTRNLTVNRRQVIVNHNRDRGGTIADRETINLIEGMSYSVSPKTNVRNSRGHLYRHINTTGDSRTGTVSNRNHTINFIYDEPREVKVEHRTLPRVSSDEGYPTNGKLLGSDTIWEYDGKTVTGYAKSNHFKDSEGYFFRPRSERQSATVNGETTIIIRYDIPRTITVHHDDKDPSAQIQSPNVKRLRTTYVKQIYDDQSYVVTPLTNVLTDRDGYYFRPVNPANRTGTILGDRTLTIEYERPRIIRLAHYDKDSNAHIRTDTHSARAYDKNSNYNNASGVDTASRYTVYSYVDEALTYHHTPNDKTYFYYVPTADRYPSDAQGRARQVGSVRDVESRLSINNNTYTLDFHYTKPAIDVGLTYIRIDTGRVIDGLPINLEFDLHKIVGSRWADEDVTLTIYDRDADDKVIYTTELDVKALTDDTNNTVERVSGQLEIPEASIRSAIAHMDKGAGHIFDAVLTTNDKEKLVAGHATSANIDTTAYTATERVIRGNSSVGESETFEFKGVAMTERHLDDEIDTYYESSFVTIDPSVSLLSGYGYESQQHVEFETEVPDHKYHRMNDLASIRGYASVHANIADGNYTFNEGRYEFNLEYPAGYQNGSRSRKVDFVMPEVHVNRRDGEITTTSNSNTVSGGRKVYVPVWTNSLGTFNYNFRTNRMGRNHIMYDLDQDITVEAYMFGHIDSETLSDDALMIEPAKTGILDRWFGGED